MVDWESLETQAQWKAALQDLLLHSDRALYRALDVLHGCQTEDEAQDRCTKWHNGMGFSASDAPLLSRIWEKVARGNYLHEWEYLELRRRLPKYWKQLMAMSPHHRTAKGEARQKEREVSRAPESARDEPWAVVPMPKQKGGSEGVSGVLDVPETAPTAQPVQGTLF